MTEVILETINFRLGIIYLNPKSLGSTPCVQTGQKKICVACTRLIDSLCKAPSFNYHKQSKIPNPMSVLATISSDECCCQVTSCIEPDASRLLDQTGNVARSETYKLTRISLNGNA